MGPRPGARPPPPLSPPRFPCPAPGRARRSWNGKRKASWTFLFFNRVHRSQKSTPNFPGTRYSHQLPTSGLSRAAAAAMFTRDPSSNNPPSTSESRRPRRRRRRWRPGKPPSSPGAAVGGAAARAASEHVPAPVPARARAASGRGAHGQAAPWGPRRTGRAAGAEARGGGPPLRARSVRRRSAGPAACARERADLCTPCFVDCRPGAASRFGSGSHLKSSSWGPHVGVAGERMKLRGVERGRASGACCVNLAPVNLPVLLCKAEIGFPAFPEN